MSVSHPLNSLWYTRCPVPTGLGIALQKGWLEESFNAQSTIIRSLRESNEQSIRESHFDHTLVNSVRHGGNIPAIWARSVGRETRVIGLSWADEIQYILTLPDSGIKTVKDLKGRKFGLPKWTSVQIDFSRAQAIRGLENALKLEGLSVEDVELVDYHIGGTQSDEVAQQTNGNLLFSGRRSGGRNAELVGLIRGEVDAIFLKGASAAAIANQFGLHVVIDVGSHPDALIRANNGTPRTLTVDINLLDNHFDSTVRILDQVLRAEQWAWNNADETRRFLAKETNSSEYWVTQAYGADSHLRLKTDLSDENIVGLQDFINFLHRWKFIPELVDVKNWIDSRPLEKALSQLASNAA